MLDEIKDAIKSFEDALKYKSKTMDKDEITIRMKALKNTCSLLILEGMPGKLEGKPNNQEYITFTFDQEKVNDIINGLKA